MQQRGDIQSSAQLDNTVSCRPALWLQRQILTAPCSVQTQGDHRGSPTHSILFLWQYNFLFLCCFFVLVFVFALLCAKLGAHRPPQNAILFLLFLAN